MKVWKGNEVECETAQHALFLNPNGRVGWPSGEPSSNVLFNRGTKIHPQRGLWVTQRFLLKNGNPNGQNSADVSHYRQHKAKFGNGGTSPSLKCVEIRSQNVEY